MGGSITTHNTAKVDNTCATVKVEPGGLVRIDGIVIGRRVERAGRVYLQFCDGDRLRASCRGTRFVEVPLESLAKMLETEKKQ